MKKNKHEEHDNHERWLVSYADFITLMFAFFVIMYATSNNNLEKQKKFEESVRANLNLVVSAGEGGGRPGSKAHREDVANSLMEIFSRNVPPEELEEAVEKEIDKKFAEKAQQQPVPKVHHDVMGVRITLAASSFFPTASFKLKREALPALDEVASILKQTNRRLIIEGHTDDQPFLGPGGETNWELASLRATSVVRYLTKVHGIAAQRLAAVSYADQKPLVSNATEDGRAQNRRIEILIANE